VYELPGDGGARGGGSLDGTRADCRECYEGASERAGAAGAELPSMCFTPAGVAAGAALVVRARLTDAGELPARGWPVAGDVLFGASARWRDPGRLAAAEVAAGALCRRPPLFGGYLGGGGDDGRGGGGGGGCDGRGGGGSSSSSSRGGGGGGSSSSGRGGGGGGGGGGDSNAVVVSGDTDSIGHRIDGMVLSPYHGGQPPSAREAELYALWRDVLELVYTGAVRGAFAGPLLAEFEASVASWTKDSFLKDALCLHRVLKALAAGGTPAHFARLPFAAVQATRNCPAPCRFADKNAGPTILSWLGSDAGRSSSAAPLAQFRLWSLGLSYAVRSGSCAFLRAADVAHGTSSLDPALVRPSVATGRRVPPGRPCLMGAALGTPREVLAEARLCANVGRSINAFLDDSWYDVEANRAALNSARERRAGGTA
jgi:hypothetical protein